MKLASIDKRESLKEEREVADVLQAWQTHAHSFNSTLYKACISRNLPALSAKPSLHLAKGPAVLTSPYACALCGLRREERITQVDVEVNDSFGEFWIENWGHLSCRDFWYQNEASLPQR